MFYIGFERLIEFMSAIDPQRDVYLAPLSIVKSGDHVSSCTASMVASQVKDDHLIYCKVDFSRWQELYGKPFGQESEERAGRMPRLQDQMWQMMIEQMRADNPDLELYEGAPSFPSDLMLVPGHVDGITYDTELHEYVKENA